MCIPTLRGADQTMRRAGDGDPKTSLFDNMGLQFGVIARHTTVNFCFQYSQSGFQGAGNDSPQPEE